MSDAIPLTIAYEEVEKALEQNDVDHALERLEHILEYYPKALRAHELLGQVYARQGRHDEALHEYVLVTSVDPLSATAYTHMATLSQKLSRPEEARRYAVVAADHLPASEDDLMSEPAPISPARLAILNLRSQLFMQAIHQFGEVVQTSHDRPDLYVGLTFALWLADMKIQAERVARVVLAASPDCLPANVVIATLAAAAGRQDEARTHISRAYETDPEGQVIGRLTLDHYVDPAWSPAPPTVPAAVPRVVLVTEPAPTAVSGAEPKASDWLEPLAPAGAAGSPDQWQDRLDPLAETAWPGDSEWSDTARTSEIDEPELRTAADASSEAEEELSRLEHIMRDRMNRFLADEPTQDTSPWDSPAQAGSKGEDADHSEAGLLASGVGTNVDPDKAPAIPEREDGGFQGDRPDAADAGPDAEPMALDVPDGASEHRAGEQQPVSAGTPVPTSVNDSESSEFSDFDAWFEANVLGTDDLGQSQADVVETLEVVEAEQPEEVSETTVAPADQLEEPPEAEVPSWLADWTADLPGRAQDLAAADLESELDELPTDTDNGPPPEPLSVSPPTDTAASEMVDWEIETPPRDHDAAAGQVTADGVDLEPAVHAGSLHDWYDKAGLGMPDAQRVEAEAERVEETRNLQPDGEASTAPPSREERRAGDSEPVAADLHQDHGPPPSLLFTLADRVEREPLNNGLRFELAQALEQAGEWQQAVEQYGLLVRSRDARLLDGIQTRLELLKVSGAELHGLQRTLGDVYMQQGAYERAIEAYSSAFDELRLRQITARGGV